MIPLLLAGCMGSPAPNFVVVTLDTTRADAIGVYRGVSGLTPNLDTLAQEGVRFDRAYAVTPLTIPAHSSLFTGLYPARHGVRDNGDQFLSDEAHTLAERLAGAGWATGAAVGAEVTSHHWGFAQGFQAFFDDLGPTRRDRWAVERPGGEVMADALGWLGQQHTDRPWFLWVHLFDAHHPYAPPPTWAAAFPDQPYQAEVAYLDSLVGTLREAVQARADGRRTWLLVMADHGEALGDHGESTHGVLLYDATVRIPLLVAPPEGGGGHVVDTPVSLVDIAPTVLELAGLPAEGMDGRSLVPQLRGQPGDPTREVVSESLYAFHHYGWAPQRALVSNVDKLIDSTTPELYLRSDRREREDLAAAQPERVAERRERVEAIYRELTPTDASRSAQLSPEQVAQLEALGYLAPQGTPSPDGPLPSGLPDPRTQLPVLGRVESARKALQGGDLATARAQLEALIADEPGLDAPQMLLVQVLARSGEVEAAERRLRLLAEEGRSGAQSMLGSLLLQQGRAREAVPVLQAAVDTDPYLLAARLPLLHALLATGDPSFPAEVDRAYAALPASVELGGLAGFVAATRGDTARAQPLLAAALAQNPNQPLLHHGWGLVLLADGEVVAAEASFEEEVRLFPPAPAARRELVSLLADQRRYEEQLAQLAVLRSLLPQDPATMHSEAQALFNLRRYPEAETAVRTCRALAPDYPGCAMLEANVLDKLGRHAEAVRAYQAALALAGQAPAQPEPASGATTPR